MEPIDYVAENILGYQRSHCWGPITPAGIFYCQWCGGKVLSWKTRPCPAYPFPAFDLVDLMRKLGEMQIGIWIRYDTMRQAANFTLIWDSGQICDTDDPLAALCRWIKEERIGEDQCKKILA